MENAQTSHTKLFIQDQIRKRQPPNSCLKLGKQGVLIIEDSKSSVASLDIFLF